MNDFAISTSTGNRAVLQGLPARLVSDGLVTDEIAPLLMLPIGLALRKVA